MFRCAGCKELSAPGETAVMAVLERAPVEHPEVYDRRREKKMPGGQGTRIVREGLMHASCALKYQSAAGEAVARDRLARSLFEGVPDDAFGRHVDEADRG